MTRTCLGALTVALRSYASRRWWKAGAAAEGREPVPVGTLLPTSKRCDNRGISTRNEDQGTRARLLLVEDDDRFAEALVAALTGQGFEVVRCADGWYGLKLAQAEFFSAVILDLMLPSLDGHTVLERLREDHDTPVLVLSAKHRVEHRVRALDGGADDYLTKPFELDELVARLRAMIRRAARSSRQRLELGDLVVDLYAGTVERAGQVAPLTPSEYRLLELLITNRGRAVTTDELATALARDGEVIDSATVRTHVRNLRSKLGHERLETHRGRGYKLNEGS